jgi:hypothetical protein
LKFIDSLTIYVQSTNLNLFSLNWDQILTKFAENYFKIGVTFDSSRILILVYRKLRYNTHIESSSEYKKQHQMDFILNLHISCFFSHCIPFFCLWNQMEKSILCSGISIKRVKLIPIKYFTQFIIFFINHSDFFISTISAHTVVQYELMQLLFVCCLNLFFLCVGFWFLVCATFIYSYISTKSTITIMVLAVGGDFFFFCQYFYFYFSLVEKLQK